MITEDDVRKTNEICIKILNHTGTDANWLFSLLLIEPELARNFLILVKKSIGHRDWIEAGLNCKLDSDIVPEAICDYLATEKVLEKEASNEMRESSKQPESG